MKILHISHCYHPSKGGVQWFFKNISERLVREYGDDVTVVTTDSIYGPEKKIYQKVEPQVEYINGVKVVRFGFTRWHLPLIRTIIKLFRLLGLAIPAQLWNLLYGPKSASMKQYLLHDNSEAVCASSSNYSFMNLPLWKKTNFFYFGSIHLEGSYRTLTHIQKRSIENSSLYLANTGYEKDCLVKAGISPGKIKVIGQGVDEKIFEVDEIDILQYRSALGIPTGAVVIGYAGRITKPKNVQLLIDAFQKLYNDHPGIYLLIAGASSDHAEALQQYVKQFSRGVQEHIKWKLDFEAEEKALLFHNMDVLVLPSHNESFGIVFLEGWVCKKPVIGVAIGAIKDVIEQGVDGLLMQVNDMDSLCTQLHTLINDEPLRIAMGEAGYNKVKEHYTWDIITRKIRECYTGELERQQKQIMHV